jgi:hypothetical protein
MRTSSAIITSTLVQDPPVGISTAGRKLESLMINQSVLLISRCSQ